MLVISLKLAVFSREHQSLSVKKAYTYKQQKDNPTRRQINAFQLPVFERETKAQYTKGQTLHQAHDQHMKKAVVCTRLSDKRFSERNFEVCLSVEKGNHSLHTSVKKIENSRSNALMLRLCQLVFFINELSLCVPVEPNDEAFFL